MIEGKYLVLAAIVFFAFAAFLIVFLGGGQNAATNIEQACFASAGAELCAKYNTTVYYNTYSSVVMCSLAAGDCYDRVVCFDAVNSVNVEKVFSLDTLKRCGG